MKTTIQEIEGNVVAILEGCLDTAAAAETAQAMSPLNDVTGKDIVIDCTKLEYISSSGLRIFLGVLKNAKAQGSKVFIKGLNDDLKRVFDEIGFTNIFQFI